MLATFLPPPTLAPPSLAAPTNFDALRLLAVGILVVGNGLVLTGGVPPGIWGAPLQRLGLDLLFSLAGYGAAVSLGRSASPGAFLLRRLRRVGPGLVAAVFVIAFAIGPFATALPRRAYLLAMETRRFLSNAILLPQPFLPRAFEGQQWSGAAHPLLWTLTAYAIGCVAVLLVGLGRRPALGAMALAVLFAAAALAWPTVPADLPLLLRRSEFADAMPEMPFFFVGAALGFLGRRYGAALERPDVALLCFAATWIAATWLDRNTLVLLWLTLPTMLVAAGRGTLPGLPRVFRFGRPAFGMFLYGFPLQQLIVARWPGVAHPILLCLGVSFVAGVLSWFLVERPALRWRPRDAGLAEASR